MKKLFAVIAMVAFFGVVSHAQSTSTDKTTPAKQEVKYCTAAEKAQCEKECAKTGVKCEVVDSKSEAKTEKSCSGSEKGGSCCSKGTTSAGGSCCQKGGAATGSTNEMSAPEKSEKRVKTKSKEVEKK